MDQPEDVRNACYERALKSSGFVRWEPDGPPESLATLLPRAYDLFGYEAEHYFPPEDPQHPDYTRLVIETREYVFSNNAFEIEIEYLISFLRLPGVKQWLRQIKIIVYPREVPEPSPSDDVSCSDLGEYWQGNCNTIKTLLEDCEQLDWVIIQIWPEDDYREFFNEEDDEAVYDEDEDYEDEDEDEEDYSEEDDMPYYSDDYYDEEDHMAYTHGITNITSHGRQTRRRIQAWLVAKRRAQGVINTLKAWGPTISPLSLVMPSQMELFRNGPKKRGEKQAEEPGKSRRGTKGHQNRKRRPQGGVYVQFAGRFVYGYHKEAACRIGGPDLDPLTCCCWSNLGLDKEIRARNEDDKIIAYYTSDHLREKEEKRTEYLNRLKELDSLRPDLEAELRRLEIGMVEPEMW
ncbi:hypothetical protein KCU98_g5646, partial [Aureobasidium melanogenum]